MTWEQVGVVMGVLAGWTVVHAYLVVPRILHECRKEWKEDIASTHAPVVERLDRFEDKLDKFNERCIAVMERWPHK